MGKRLRYWTLILFYGAILWFGFITDVRASDLDRADPNYVLGRLSFGNTSEQLKAVEAMGIEAYIQSQLEPSNISESKIAKRYIAKFDDNYQHPLELQSQFADYQKQIKRDRHLPPEEKQELLKKKNQLRRKSINEATKLRLARAVYSSRQLQELMVDFWFNHFNVFAVKGVVSFWLSDYEDQIRDRALGNFRDLLEVTATNPAMLIYLDNQFNTDPKSSWAKGNYSGINENYARELMELHTLGVDGGYSQTDIVTLAKIFTGWTIEFDGKRAREDGFFFNQKRHDSSDKVFLGQKISGGGIEEGRKALDILATHPATARFISYKLAQYFVADEPPSSLVDSMAQKFTQSNGNIKAVMDTLIHSPEFSDPQYSQEKFKTPYQYLVSLVRIGEIKRPDFRRLQGMLEQLSMPLYSCVPPTGYRNTQEAWLNPQAMLQRITLASAIAEGQLDSESTVEYKKLTNNLGELSSKTQQVVNDSPELRTALLLGSPEAMYR